MLIGLGTSDERAAILKLWDQKQDTWIIGKLLSRPEFYVERQLHMALDTRRAVQGCLSPK
jgi:hypothetical protein